MSENVKNATISVLMTLTAKEPKEECKQKGLKVTGNKMELAERLDDPRKTSSGGGGNAAAKEKIHAALKEAGYENPERPSCCAKRAIQRGFLTLEGGLDKEIFAGSCICCDSEVSCTLRDVLKQSDYGGMDYEDGADNGALKGEEDDCGTGMYLTLDWLV